MSSEIQKYMSFKEIYAFIISSEKNGFSWSLTDRVNFIRWLENFLDYDKLRLVDVLLSEIMWEEDIDWERNHKEKVKLDEDKFFNLIKAYLRKLPKTTDKKLWIKNLDETSFSFYWYENGDKWDKKTDVSILKTPQFFKNKHLKQR